MAATGEDEGARLTKKTKLDYLDAFTVLVGASEVSFMVHKNIACDTSDFFRAACDGNWKEAIDKTIKLPEIEQEAFKVYIGWLYTRNIDIRQDVPSETYTKDISSKDFKKTCTTIVQAYALGDMISNASFRNAVMDEALEFAKSSNRAPSFREITLLYDMLPLPTKLSRLFVDIIFAQSFSPETFAEKAPSFPTAFITNLACVCVEERDMTRRERDPRRRPKCFYHDHKDDSSKCA